jgi:hypothetical protein
MEDLSGLWLCVKINWIMSKGEVCRLIYTNEYKWVKFVLEPKYGRFCDWVDEYEISIEEFSAYKDRSLVRITEDELMIKDIIE